MLAKEDSFYENLTPVFFMLASVLFFTAYRRTKNIFLLGLVFLLFFGAGEEISWGQRIFNFKTPASMDSINTQHEFNIHNLDTFSYADHKGVKKTGLRRLLDMNTIYRIFSMTYLTVMPIVFFYIKPRRIANRKFQIPIVPISIGIFFLITLIVFYALKYLILPRGKELKYYLSITEIFEFTTSYIYFIVALYFYNRKDNDFLGKYIKDISCFP